MRILCLVDLALPLDGRSARELTETCRALAQRGHDVTIVARPATVSPPRDPFAVHGIDPSARLRFEAAALPAGTRSPRARLLDAISRRILARDADAIYTRDPGIAARVLNTRRFLRAPLLYDSPGYGPTLAAALPEPPSDTSMKALEAREARLWTEAEAYVGRTVDLISDLTRQWGRRRFATVITDADVAGGHLAERLEGLLRQVVAR